MIVAPEVSFAVLRDLTNQHLRRSGCRSVIDGSCCARWLNSLAREKKAPKPAVATAASAARAEHRQFFVMFLRSSGSTALSARMDPEDLAIISALSESA